MRNVIQSGALALAILLPSIAVEASDSRDRVCGERRGRGSERLGRLDVVGLTADQRLICFGR